MPTGTEIKPFLNIREGSQTEKFAKRAIALHALVFIKASYPATDAELVSKEFAKEIYGRKDWSLQEVKNFIRFIKDNADKKEFQIIGNSIGLMQIMKFLIIYEQQRSENRESKHQYHKSTELNSPLPIPKEQYQKLINTIKSAKKKVEYTGKQSMTFNAFDPIKFEEHFEQFKELITDMSRDEKKEWINSIYGYDSIEKTEMERREKLLSILKNKPRTN